MSEIEVTLSTAMKEERIAYRYGIALLRRYGQIVANYMSGLALTGKELSDLSMIRRIASNY